MMGVDTVKEKYAELVTYISQMGYKTQIPLESQAEITLQLFNYFGDEIIKVHLFQPLYDSREYNYHHLRVSWKIPSECSLGHNVWYEETTNQSVIFKRLLFDILNWKIQNVSEDCVSSSNQIIYEVIKNWSIAEKRKYQSSGLLDSFKKLLSIFHVCKNN